MIMIMISLMRDKVSPGPFSPELEGKVLPLAPMPVSVITNLGRYTPSPPPIRSPVFNAEYEGEQRFIKEINLDLYMALERFISTNDFC